MTAGAVVITAADGSLAGLAERLRDARVPVRERPLLRFAPPATWAALDDALRHLDEVVALAVTSPRAGRAVAARHEVLRGRGEAGPLDRVTVWAAGGASAATLRHLVPGVRLPDGARASKQGAAARLARAMLAAGVAGPVLFPCGDLRRDELPRLLREAGVEVREVRCYRTELASEADARAVAGAGEIVVVTSPSVAHLLSRACDGGPRPRLLAIGPSTADAARGHGWEPAAVAARADVDAVLEGLHALLAVH